MKFTFPAFKKAITLLSVLMILNSCNKDFSTESKGFISVPAEKTITTTIQGQVYDENGRSMTGAQVSITGASTQSDKYGFFRLENVPINQNGGLVKVTKTGYFPGSRSMFYKTGVTNFVRIEMIPKKLVGTIDAAAGGNVSFNGASVSLPANAVIRAAAGSGYSGSMNVYAAYLDPSDNNTNRKMPGSLLGVQADNTLAGLESFGMVAVELESSAGEKLRIAGNAEATLSFPLPAATTAPATIPLWYFDDASGFWKQEGTAVKTGNTYIGKVKHFSFWNCDYPYGVVDFKVRFTDQAGQPIVHSSVYIKTLGPNVSTGYGLTDSTGTTSGKIPKNQVLTLELAGQCNQVAYTQSIGPANSAVDLGTIAVTLPVLQQVTVTGTVLNCAGTPVSAGYAILVVDNRVYRANTDNIGRFSMSFQNCSANGTGSITGVDVYNAQEGAAVSISLGAAPINAGNLTACGVSTQSFINYTIDGTSYSLSTPADTIVVYGGGTGNSPETFVSGAQRPSFTQKLDFSFSGPPTVAGTHLLTRMNTNAIPGYINTASLPVTLTEYGIAPGYVAGSFTGNVTDSLNTHSVSCTFRIKRQ